ncbi:hypothetical protein KXV68_002342 [Aspergillus fumigatus]|nr:hypothetical protein KXX67_003023 [Aspergillus fumigatus]KAH1897640.1 hypothetical protein KXW69_001913 [Aspergillus fumigatus]KAH2147430.1 hypothetical protein KXV68_002342 [Aspergillus fumigatus]KAH2280995.1 hypothetical protein KXW96_000162 [Aspergillus fumigatus]KAH2349506.1 hypothetical protein KXW91_003077 [Aspergillus fumigatus]
MWQVSVKDCAGVLRYSEMNTIIAQVAQGNLRDARTAFEGSVMLRSRLVPSDFDTGKVAALERLEFVATRLGDVLAADHFRGLVNNIYSAVESRDMEERAADATVVEIPT